MASGRQQHPASWGAYDREDRRESSDSRPSVTFDDQNQRHSRSTDHAFLQPSDAQGEARQQSLRRRRSSMLDRVQALRHAGGPNSLENFAKSWQRAAGFNEVMPVRQSFVVTDDGEDEAEYSRSDVESSPTIQRSLLRQQLEESGNVFEDDEDEAPEIAPRQRSSAVAQDANTNEQSPLLRSRISRPSHRRESILNIEPSLSSPFGASYGTTWGSMASRSHEPPMRHASRLFREQQQSKLISEFGQEREPLHVKEIEDDDGRVVNVVVGRSTVPQTIFNSVNVLIGVGILALPLAIRYAGWIVGLSFLLASAITTRYTAVLLAKCADVDNSIITFADLAYVSFGTSARIATSVLFSLELIGACVALVVLFADSLDSLIPGWGVDEWKIVCGIILIPLGFVPLRLLSFTSILGIVCCFGIVLAVFVDGLIKPHQPGSLREPAKTFLFPENWFTLPIALGLLMSPWGGHSVFPNIYRDMRHPYKYRKAVNVTYSFTFLLDISMAIVGLLMFGDGIMDEVTKNIFTTKGYPRWLNLIVMVAIAIIPLTKVPLNARPIVSTIEVALGIDTQTTSNNAALAGFSGLTRGILKITVRILCTILFVILAILVPEFDRIMSLVGAVACFTICIILPCGFHLKLFGNELRFWQKALDWTLIVVSTALALVSTAFNLIPKDKLGL